MSEGGGFEAGGIFGKLGLDISEYGESMRESTSLAGEFAEQVGHILSEATGSPILGLLANGITEVVSAASEGNWGEVFSASIHTAGEAASTAIEVFKHVAEEFHEVGIQAERAGVSVEWFSTFGKAAEAFGTNLDGLGFTMKFLQRNAAEAVDGNKELTAAFQAAGISTEFLNSHLDDTQGLFEKVIQQLGHVDTESAKTNLSMALLGKSGNDLKPIFADGGKAADELAEKIRKLGGGVTEEDAKMGHDFGVLGVEFKALIDGMEKDASRPIMKDLLSHSKELESEMSKLADVMGKEIPLAMDSMAKEFENLSPDLMQVVGGLKDVLSVAAKSAEEIIHLYAITREGMDNIGEWAGYYLAGSAQTVEGDARNQRGGYDPDGVGMIGGTRAVLVNHPQADGASAHATVNLGPINVTIDPDAISGKIVKGIKPHIEKAINDHGRKVNAKIAAGLARQ